MLRTNGNFQLCKITQYFLNKIFLSFSSKMVLFTDFLKHSKKPHLLTKIKKKNISKNTYNSSGQLNGCANLYPSLI